MMRIWVSVGGAAEDIWLDQATVGGRRLRRLAGIPDDHDMWEVGADRITRRVRDGDRIRVRNGMRIYTTPISDGHIPRHYYR